MTQLDTELLSETRSEKRIRFRGSSNSKVDAQPTLLDVRAAVDPLAMSGEATRSGSTQRAQWFRAYRTRLVLGDAAAVLAANLIGVAVRFGVDSGTALHGVDYGLVGIAISLAWLLMLYASRSYERRFVGNGSEEFKRVGSASVRLVAAVCLITVAFKLDPAREFLLIALGLGTTLLLINRHLGRRLLAARRRTGEWCHRVLLVGDENSAADLAGELSRDPSCGLHVVGACVADLDARSLFVDGVEIPVVGELGDIPEAARRVDADTIAVSAAPSISPQVVRRLAWQLEGSGMSLAVAPALTNIAGPRISIRPVSGMPLLQVEEPEITGIRYLVKELVERAVAVFLAVLSLPAVAAIAVAIKLDSPGPVLFRQRRVKRGGGEFSVYKFRSMHVDAEARFEQMSEANIHGSAPIFKMHDDPRVTGVGRWLRRYSVDELPQLWNVVKGDMALVGPRPPLPSEVASYATDVKRRLLVKPGMTGLWQVSGRSDLSWEETVRLDLYYVENWSLAMDAQILIRTWRTVLAGRGAY